MEIKSGKMLKNLEVFFKATTSAFRSEFLFQFGQILYSVSPVRLQHTVKKALFLCFLRSRLITYLITLSLEKKILVLEKSLEKALNFGCKNLNEPCHEQNWTKTVIECT